jgi:hypothetical protein
MPLGGAGKSGGHRREREVDNNAIEKRNKRGVHVRCKLEQEARIAWFAWSS